MEQLLKNSKHATTSLEGKTATATATMTATQMRATLIYLAPFLQPCKNAVTSTSTTTTAAAIKTRAESMPQQCFGNAQDIPATRTTTRAATTTTATVVLQQQTHVARNRLNTSRNNNHNNAINSKSTIINNNNKNNNNDSRHCCSNTPNTKLTTKTLSCEMECVCKTNGMGRSSSCSQPTTTTTTTTTSSSCCHNTMQQIQKQQQTQQGELKTRSEYQKEKQVKEQNFQQKDKYDTNYKMPALETTTTIKTTTANTTQTLLYSSNNDNKTRNQQQQKQKQKHLKEDKTSSSSTSTSSLLSISSSSSTLRTPSTSFVNYTNNRSTKYLSERGRRNILLQFQQQEQEQTLKQQKTYGSLIKQQQQQQLPPSIMQQTLRHEKQRNQTYRNRGPYIAKDDHHHGTNINSNNTLSVLSRCHCLNFNQHNKNNNHNNNNKNKNKQKIMLNNNVQDMKQQPKLENNHMKTLMSSINCDGQPEDLNNEKTVYDNHYEAGNLKENIYLRLRNNHQDKNMEMAEMVEKEEKQEKKEKLKNSYINFKELLFYTNTKTLHSNSQTPSSSQSTATTTATTSSSSSLSLLNPSYTTILNEECRCFKQYKRDTIGSECNLEQRNLEITEDSVAEASSSQTPSSPSDNYCMIKSRQTNGDDAAFESSSLGKKLWPNHWLMSLIVGCSVFNKTAAVSKWLFMWLLIVMLSTSAHCWAGRNDVPTNCTFPARWEGSWFLSGYQQSIHIKGSQFSYRGRCAASDGNKYLIVDEKGCHRCLVIYEKHNNVLQYKESECEGDSMYMHQTNPSAMAMRSVLNQKANNNGGEHRGGAHPNLNGHSRLSSSDQYIMRSNDDMNDYFCKGRETLQNLCDQIPGDALLYSLFRESAEPVKCPLKGPFIFTYNRGNGECKSPVSNIESCTEDSRLLLSFQACPDVVGTESTVEELTCLATWKDGNSRYLVGLVSHHHAISNEERYRCFVYEKISSLMDLGHFAGPSMSTSKDAEYKLAQSGDATCNGLDSAEVGSRIMSLRKPPVTERCDFPVWFKGPRHWHVLMGNAVYNYHTNDGSIHIIKPNGYMETRALCEQINKQTSTEMMSVVHYTTGCQSGFMCMMFYRRDTHVIEIQTGKPASRLEDACAIDHFDINKTPYITLLASNPDPQICPMEGLYSLRGAIGPPYLTTRHKRNHNKAHGFHNHHHQYGDNVNGREYLHKRHQSLSFRSAQHDEKNAWHSNTRGLPIRSRRDASSTVTPLIDLMPNQTHVAKTTQLILVVDNTTNVDTGQSSNSDNRLRSRRNVPECVTNYKAQRQLWVGCTEPNVIDVRPLCNDEGDEEYSCHGSWSENGTVYIIARHKGTKHGVCISYRPTEGIAAKLVVGDACYRGTQKPPEHHLVANLSVFGKCGETGSISSTITITSWLHLLTAIILITLSGQFPLQR